MRARHRITSLGSALVLAAGTLPSTSCAPDQSGEPDQVALLQIEETTSIQLTGGTPRWPIAAVTEAALIPGGGFVFLDPHEGRFRVFAADGTPGTPSEPSSGWDRLSIRVTPEGLFFVWDDLFDRGVLRDADWGVLTTVELAQDAYRNYHDELVGRLPDGSIILEVLPASWHELMEQKKEEHPGGPWQDTLGYLLFRPDGSFHRRLARVPGPTRFYRKLGPDKGAAVVDYVFGRTVSGMTVAGALAVASSDPLTFDVFPLDDGAPYSIGVETVKRPASDDQVHREYQTLRDSLFEAIKLEYGMLDYATPPGAEERALVLQEPERSPTTLPDFRSVRSGDDGSVWMEEFPYPEDDVVNWVVLDETLAPVARLVLPRTETWLAATADRLLTFARDETGNGRVRAYRIVR